MISKPGIFVSMPSAEYFSDPCPQPSLTQSIAKILLERSPLHAWHAHPRLNPDFKPDDDTKFDVGNIAHRLLIGRGKEISVLDFTDWRTNAAKEARAQSAKVGKLAVLSKHFMIAQAMARAAHDGCEAAGCYDAFHPDNGNGEVVIAWQEPDGFWCRSMIDWLSTDVPLVYDFKTTDMSVAPHGIGRMMVNAGWDIQAAMIERGLDVLDPDNAGRRKFRFVAQEAEKPFAVTVCELSEAVLTMGRKKLGYAMDLWAHCLAQDRWPGYATDIAYPEYPGWAESQWLEREYAAASAASLPRARDDLTVLDAG